MNPEQLIDLADNMLKEGERGRPQQIILRRAISTAYYALFHQLSKECANFVVGTNPSDDCWCRVYRSLGHNTTKNACLALLSEAKKQKTGGETLPDNVGTFVSAFLNMQSERQDADYNPLKNFYKSSTQRDIDVARKAISALQDATKEEKKRLLILTLFRKNR